MYSPGKIRLHLPLSGSGAGARPPARGAWARRGARGSQWV